MNRLMSHQPALCEVRSMVNPDHGIGRLCHILCTRMGASASDQSRRVAFSTLAGTGHS